MYDPKGKQVLGDTLEDNQFLIQGALQHKLSLATGIDWQPLAE